MLEKGYHVLNVDALTYAGNLQNLAELSGHPRYSFIRGDVADRDAVRSVFQRGISDVIPDSPAARAGVTAGARIIAVNGRRYSSDALSDFVKASATSTAPIELILERGDLFSTSRVDYHGGPRYPHLERIDGKPDLLTVLGRSLAKK